MPGIFLQAFGFRTTKGFFFASRYGGSLILLSSLTWSSTQYTPVVRTLQNTTLPHIACKKSRTTDARLFLLRRQTCRSDSNAPLRLVRRNFVRRWMSRCGLDDGTPCPGVALAKPDPVPFALCKIRPPRISLAKRAEQRTQGFFLLRRQWS